MWQFIKRDWLLLVLLFGSAGYLGHAYLTRAIPCVTPIHYTLASYDKRFPISQSELEQTLTRAAGVWNDAIGKQVLVQGSPSELPVRLVYDNRQASQNVATSLDTKITAKEAELKQLAAQYESQKQAYESAQSEGSATRAMYDALNALAQQYEELRLNVNADVAKYNSAIPQDEYNEARYVRDQSGARIEVYSFKDKVALERVLEHELGHALGLEHVAGANSIMYPVNKGRNFDLSSEDKAELERVCTTPQPFFTFGTK